MRRLVIGNQNSFLLAVLLLGLLAACDASLNQDKSFANDREARFQAYLSELPEFPFPLGFSTHPDSNFNFSSVEMIPDLYKEFKHVSASEPLGKMLTEGGTILVLEQIPSDPQMTMSFTTFNEKGEKLDSLIPYAYSGWDQFYFGVEYLSLNSNLQLTIYDTIYRWQEDSLGLPIEASKSRETGERLYQINEKGSFKIVQPRERKLEVN